VAGYIFQARPVWIYTQSNITNIIFTPEYTTPAQKKCSTIPIITYLLRPRETVCFVDPRPPLTAVEGPQNTLLSRGLCK
jgi:hypothetical protein